PPVDRNGASRARASWHTSPTHRVDRMHGFPLPPLPTMSDAPIFRSGPKACCAILLALALVACGAGGEAESQGAGPPAVVVTTAVVSTQPFNDRIRALGTVKAREAVEVTAKVSETVDRVHFESG